MTSTAAARLYIAIQQAIRTEAPTFELAAVDGLELLDGIALGCPEHAKCVWCGEPVCPDNECGINLDEPRAPDCHMTHCDECWPECRPCATDRARDAAEQLALDTALGK